MHWVKTSLFCTIKLICFATIKIHAIILYLKSSLQLLLTSEIARSTNGWNLD